MLVVQVLLAACGVRALRAPSRLQLRSAVRMGAQAPAAAKPYTLFDVPVSNNGARVRMVVYYTDSEDAVEILPPSELGGLGSDAYRAVHPEAKMPALVRNADGLNVPESDTIARFLGGKFGTPTTFAPAPGSELAVRSDKISRFHDCYLAPIQGCLDSARKKRKGNE